MITASLMNSFLRGVGVGTVLLLLLQLLTAMSQ